MHFSLGIKTLSESNDEPKGVPYVIEKCYRYYVTLEKVKS